MLDLYFFDDELKRAREEHHRYHLRRAQWAERQVWPVEKPRSSGWRRRLARALLALADRIQPRVIRSPSFRPACPALNGTSRCA